jgi:hypothetical protein
MHSMNNDTITVISVLATVLIVDAYMHLFNYLVVRGEG